MQKILILLLLLSYAVAKKHYLVKKKGGKTILVKAKGKAEAKRVAKGSSKAKTGLKSSAGWIDAKGLDYTDDTADKYTDDNHENHDHGKDESCDEAAVGEETVPQGGEASGGEASGGSCKIHYECRGGEVCTREGSCQHITCKKDPDCKAKVALPSKCKSAIPGGQKFCSPDSGCTDSDECMEAGKNFVCHKASGQCKPSYGKCENTCDCLDNFGMVKGEALCDYIHHSGNQKRVCLCRSDDKAECGKGAVEEEEPPQPAESYETTPAPREPQVTIIHAPPPTEITDEVVDGGSAPEPTTPAPVTEIEPDPEPDAGAAEPTTPAPEQESCPLPRKDEPQGEAGAPCNVHAACLDFNGLVCAKPKTGQGKCEKLTCQTDEECTSKTSLPTQCSGGECKVKHCYENTDCPKGYACDSGGQCKQDLGSCKYDCDCSQCDAAICFKGHCICKADHDECTVAPGQENAEEKYGSGGSAENSETEEKYGSGGNSVDPAESGDSGKEGEEDGKWTDVPEVADPEGHLIEDSNENPTIYPADEATEQPPPGDAAEGDAEENIEESGAPEQPPESGAPEAAPEQSTEPATDGEGAAHEGAGSDKQKFRKVEFASQQECLTCECPEGWQKTASGCYKLFKDRSKDKVGRKVAQRKCTQEGGFIAEVTTKKEMINLQSVFENKVIPVWLGAQRMKGESFKWNSGERFTEDQVDEEGNEGGCLIRKAQKKLVVACEEKYYVLCEVAKLQPGS